MAELHQIVGAVLRDVARARASSDIYSRDLSRYYESDSLLRRFPVPRSEIEGIELDLRFVIEGVANDDSGSAGAEASLGTVFANGAFDLAQKYFSLLMDAAKDWGAPAGSEETWGAFRKSLSSEPRRIDLHQDLLNYFSRNQGHLVSNGELSVDATLAGARHVLGAALERLFEKSGFQEPADGRFSATLEAKGVLEQVKLLAEGVRVAFSAGGDRRVNVDVTANTLRETPEAAVSTLKLKATVKNYVWSDVNEVDGRKWRRLNPE